MLWAVCRFCKTAATGPSRFFPTPSLGSFIFHVCLLWADFSGTPRAPEGLLGGDPSPKSLEKAPSVYPSGLPPSVFGYFKHR